MNAKNKISTISRILLIVAAIFLASNIFLPIWKIELFAPQYPEGLVLLIYADTLGGNVDIINGLNHYIGMQTLHTENFIEFSIMKYIFIFFSGLIILTAVIGHKKGVLLLFIIFVIFSLVAMADFYRWNYNYGHNLDPTAAIKVPGMAYQPPLIGYKQLLNFGAYSMPALGGLFFIGSGILILLALLLESRLAARWIKRKTMAVVLGLSVGLLSFASCGDPGPRALKLNVDTCAYCRMTITNAHFATQLTTQKGRKYMFDDIMCMVSYRKENAQVEYAGFYVADFCHPVTFVDPGQATLLHSDSLRSPMAGNIAGFAIPDSAQYYKSRYNAREVSWTDLIR